MNCALPGQARPPSRRPGPQIRTLLIPAIMAIAMSLVMSLVQTVARLGFTPSLASAWLTSFAIGAAVAIPTAILVAPRAQQLASHLTGAPHRPPQAAAQPPGTSSASSSASPPAAIAPQTTGTQESR